MKPDIYQSWVDAEMGYIEADNKQAAREALEVEYGKKITMRCKREDVSVKYFMFVRLYEPNSYWDNFWNARHNCKQCDQEFTELEKKKLHDGMYNGSSEFCCLRCQDEYRAQNFVEYSDGEGPYAGVIYRITNKITEKSYVGQTTQYFTFRWFQHFKSNNTKKFGIAIKNSHLEDWIFDVLKSVDRQQKNENADILNELERHYINKFDCINNGYNTR